MDGIAGYNLYFCCRGVEGVCPDYQKIRKSIFLVTLREEFINNC